MSSGKILVVDDEENMTWLFQQIFSPEFNITGVIDAASGISLLNKEQFDLLLLDLKMPKIDGLQALKVIHHNYPELPVVMMTAYATVQTAVEAMKLGAIDYIIKPFNTKELRVLIRNILQKHAKMKNKNTRIEQQGEKPKIITINREMINELDIIQKVADTGASVLIEGESGTGKELVAAALHDNSQRRDRTFVSINCAAIPENLIEAELFGYEKGAFTGAYTKKEGLFETADKGTFFLDEIGDLPLFLQSKLLRVLEEKKITRVGGVKKIPVDVRTICATNKNLREEVQKGNFREDLYFRLAVIHVTLPPMRKRPEDIDLLAKYFLNYFSMKYNKSFNQIEEEAMNCLLNYPWPGNVRELKNYIERIVILEDDEVLYAKYLARHLPSLVMNNKKLTRTMSGYGSDITDAGKSFTKPLKEEIAQLQVNLEREMIIQALKKYDGNRTKAARDLQISRRCLQLKIKSLNIEK